jgi:hypothetical protein
MGRLLREGNWAYITDRQQISGWVILALGMIIPGTLLAVNPSFWTTQKVLEGSLYFSWWTTTILASIVAFAGVCALFRKTKDIAYTCGLIFYATITLAYFIALCQGVQIGALFLAPLLVSFLYYIAASISFSEREHVLHEEGLTPHD